MAFCVKGNPAAVVASGIRGGFCFQQVLPLDKAVIAQFCACEHGDPFAVPVAGEGEVDPVTGFEVGWHGDIEHAGLALCKDSRCALQRSEAFAACIEQVDLAPALGDQQLVVREKGHAPGNAQAVDDFFQQEGCLFALDAPGRVGMNCQGQQGEQAGCQEQIYRGQTPISVNRGLSPFFRAGR